MHDPLLSKPFVPSKKKVVKKPSARGRGGSALDVGETTTASKRGAFILFCVSFCCTCFFLTCFHLAENSGTPAQPTCSDVVIVERGNLLFSFLFLVFTLFVF